MKKALIFLMITALAAAMCLPACAAEADRTLTLVNPGNTVPADWSVDLVGIGNGHKVDRACYNDLMEMLAACKAAGHTPAVKSSYRTQNAQKQLYENKVRQWKGYGYSEEEARKQAATIVAIPGTSEHQLGWAVDIVDDRYHSLNEKQATMPTQIWLMEHSWEYGFLLRYPVGKSEVTGIIYEPWHYRWVGRDNARAIYESGLCLEEYLERQAVRESVRGAIGEQYGAIARQICEILVKKTLPASVMKP
ncbi:MAG: M15 family metallopeptidase [Clostridia bacterium]|nr:M15 family metallopeptidase [Clostridia bacterium]